MILKSFHLRSRTTPSQLWRKHYHPTQMYVNQTFDSWRKMSAENPAFQTVLPNEVEMRLVSKPGNEYNHFSSIFVKTPLDLTYTSIIPGCLPWKREFCLLRCFFWLSTFLLCITSINKRHKVALRRRIWKHNSQINTWNPKGKRHTEEGKYTTGLSTTGSTKMSFSDDWRWN